MKRLVRMIQARRRLAVGTLCGVAAYVLLPADRLFGLPGGSAPLVRAVLAWDLGSLVFLVAAAVMFSVEPMARIASDARRDQEGEWTIFWFTIAAVGASFAAIVGVFTQSRDASPEAHGLQAAVVGGTLLLSWLVTHVLFGLRYAHEYYDGPEDGSAISGGLEFPGGEKPDYWDFMYFALVLGMTFQVSDVQITSRAFRRLAAAHGLIGFLFNTVILALSVNIGASLL